ncbi:MAG TPA: DUF4296 domain-containing protein [Chitinophagaceae bacterium]|nr:DUF4296 domain-containing protein [Chitinophagaceae bacterium]
MIRVTLLLVLFLISSCSGKDEIPSDVLAKDEMKTVLWDMIRADQFLQNYVFAKDTSAKKKQESISLYQQVLNIHGISKEKFEKSFAYYKSNPQLIQSIMDSLSQAPLAIPVDTKADPSDKSNQPSPINNSDTLPVPLRKIRKVSGN